MGVYEDWAMTPRPSYLGGRSMGMRQAPTDRPFPKQFIEYGQANGGGGPSAFRQNQNTLDPATEAVLRYWVSQFGGNRDAAISDLFDNRGHEQQDWFSNALNMYRAGQIG